MEHETRRVDGRLQDGSESCQRRLGEWNMRKDLEARGLQ